MTTSKSLTDHSFWEKYWNSKEDLIIQIPNNYPFFKELTQIISSYQIKNSIEIGGFPGYYSIWASKKFSIQTTLLDFFIQPELIEKLKKKNNCPHYIHLLTHDLFFEQKATEKSYDLAFSNGLIEHFEDTKFILSKHLEYINSGGYLFITLPNFKGLNGWFQKTFDPENYNKHFIPCMDLDYLRTICNELELKNIKVQYSGIFTIWLEEIHKKPWFIRAFKNICWLPLKILFKIIPIETKMFSPYIYILAQK